MKIHYLFLFLFLLGCSAQKELTFSEEDANYKNGQDSEVRSVRFSYLGEGNRVEFKFVSQSGKPVNPNENSVIIVCEDIEKWSGHRLIFDHPTFPFHFNIRYDVLEMLRHNATPEKKFCEFNLTINKPGSWRVEVNH